MARRVLILLLPILLSLSLLAEAAGNNLLAEDNKEDDSLILHDAFEQNPLIRLPSEKENEMLEVPRLKEGETDFISSSPLKERETDSSLLGGERREGRKGLRFGRPGAGCRHRHRHGGEMKFRHGFHGDHFRFHPQFLPTVFEDSALHGEEAVSERRSFPGEFIPQAENEKSGFEPREKAFERFPERDHGEEGISSFPREFFPQAENEEPRFEPREREFERNGGKPVFPDREHTHDHGRHGEWGWDFPNREEHKHRRHGDHHGGEGFPRFPGEFFPGTENEETRFEPRERPFEHNGGKPVFPDREHTHDNGRHGESGWDFPNREEHKHRKHGDHHGGEGFPRFPGEFFPGTENEETRFEPRERPFEHNGGKPVFPDREHTHDNGRHGESGWDFPNREEHKHKRHGDHHGGEGFPRFPGEFFPGTENEEPRFEPRERPFEHNGGKPVFPDREHHAHEHGRHGEWGWDFPNGEEHRHRSHGHHGEEGISSFPGEFFPRAENEEPRFEPRDRAFEHGGRPFFPDREHTHDHGRHGQRGWDFPNGGEHKHWRHERHEHPPAPWTDWLRSLFVGH